MSTDIARAPREGLPFLVGDWVVEPSLNRITRAGVSIQLELRAVDVLLCLVEHAGEVVPKDLFLDTVWQTEFVSDNTLANRIAELRSAFGDDAQRPRYIETIRKRGYRLIAEVRPVTAEDDVASVFPDATPSPDGERNPYPGLAAFTEADAENFFGREAEAAALWRRITSRRLLAVIGPSGVGKSSLLRAGVAPRAPPGWRVVVFTPGEAPELSLARALAPDHAGDPAAMARLLGFSDADTALAVVARWRGLFDEAVLVLDQFEELFTLNPPEVQASFIDLLRRLVDAADVHLVLAMRDDYLYRCQGFDEIAPIFRELTPLPPPKAEGLRRALREPAARLLYRFESELLVDRIVSEVEGERGALPLMAFAVHRLWEKRDRERRELTEEAYERIGGVAGALARHADATLERIGPERQPIVRELFRNLVTAEGTRAIREVDELLEVFEESALPSVASKTLGVRRLTSHSERSERSRLTPDSERSERSPSHSSPARDAAEEVLRELIDARLLTGYREQNHDERPVHRVEIVHESLLTSWPRLVRWRTQDADSARLRDELRQAARLWDDHGRAKDYLWTGKAFREFAVWREGYPGGLTDVEEDFTSAMTTHATRRRRRRRLAVTTIIAVLLAVLVVVGTLWRRSVREAKRAEAAKLLALGQLRLEDYPTATLAHAIASLELADTPEARRLALRALWEGPTAFEIISDSSWDARFSPDDSCLIQATTTGESGKKRLHIVGAAGSVVELGIAHPGAIGLNLAFSADSDHFVSFGSNNDSTLEHILWSASQRRRLSDVHYELPAFTLGVAADSARDRYVIVVRQENHAHVDSLEFKGTVRRLGDLDLPTATPDELAKTVALDERKGRFIGFVRDGEVQITAILDDGLSKTHRLGRAEGEIVSVEVDPLGEFLATANKAGIIKLWDVTNQAPPTTLQTRPGVREIGFTDDGSVLHILTSDHDTWSMRLFARTPKQITLIRQFAPSDRMSYSWAWDAAGQRMAWMDSDWKIHLWSMTAPRDAQPIVLCGGNVLQGNHVSFNARGTWLASAHLAGLTAWPMANQFASVLREDRGTVNGLVFEPNGEWLVSASEEGTVRLWPLGGDPPAGSRVLASSEQGFLGLAVSPGSDRILAGTGSGGVQLLSPNGENARTLGGFVDQTWGTAFSADGKLAALAGGRFDPTERVIEVWDVDTDSNVAVLDVGERTNVTNVQFLPDGRLLSATISGLICWDIPSRRRNVLFAGNVITFSADESGKRAIVGLIDEGPGLTVHAIDIDAQSATSLSEYGDQVRSVTIDPTGSFAAVGTVDGEVMVGPLDGGQPHLLLGHRSSVWSVAIDPFGRWIASGSQDGEVRLWPMPDLSKPPLHTLPHDELMAKLKSLTNLRVVRDQESETGWTLTHDPFPGWETVPSW